MAEIRIDTLQLTVQGDVASARQLAGQLRGALDQAFGARASELAGLRGGQLHELRLAPMPAAASAERLAESLAQAVVAAATSTSPGRS